jgi:RimJ/RimL family protein N-acetyltransferase
MAGDGGATATWIVKGAAIGLTAPRREEFVARWDLFNDPLLSMILAMPTTTALPGAATLPPYHREQQENMFNMASARGLIAFDLCSVEDGTRPVGEAFLHSLAWPHASAELSLIVFDPRDRGRRYGIEALRLVCAYAFDVLGLHRVFFHALALNLPLLKGFEKHEELGFRRVGEMREAVWAFGSYQDLVIYEVLCTTFPPDPLTEHLRRNPYAELEERQDSAHAAHDS